MRAAHQDGLVARPPDPSGGEVSADPASRVGNDRQPTQLGHKLAQEFQPLLTNSRLKRLIPVRLPPGRGRLVTRPSLTGSWGMVKTIGIVVVAPFAANA